MVGPRFFAYSLKDGSFARGHKRATDALKRACPKQPQSVVVAQGKGVNLKRTALNVGCARARGVGTEALTSELDQQRSALCGEAEDCASLRALRAWAEADPPAKL
jgi:hypothetical protein